MVLVQGEVDYAKHHGVVKLGKEVNIELLHCVHLAVTKLYFIINKKFFKPPSLMAHQ